MSGMFSTGLSGLNVARVALTTTAHNTANVNTPGYSRQTIAVEGNGARPTGAGFIGTGARVVTVARNYDRYLQAQLTQAESGLQALDTYATQAGHLDDLLAERASGLSALVQTFFAAVEGVANTPADPAARQQMLSAAEAVAGKFRALDGYVTDRNVSLNEEIQGHVRQINAFASQVAVLNRQISQLSAMAGGQPPNDLLDQRDRLVSELAKLVGVTVVEQDGGQYNLFVGTGQSLVLGDRAATMAAVPAAADPTRYAVALVAPQGDAVEIDEQVLTGGSLGGVLAFRREALASTQNAIGRLAVTLGTAFNAQHSAGVDLAGVSGGEFFAVGRPATFSDARNGGDQVLTATFADAGRLTASDYSVAVTDAGGTLAYAVTRLSDGARVAVTPAGGGPESTSFSGFPVTFDGITVSATGTAQGGDSFLIRPTRDGARDLAVLLKEPARIAAAGSPVATATTSAAAAIGPVLVDASYRTAPLQPSQTIRATYDGASLSFDLVNADGSSSSLAAGPYVSGQAVTVRGITVAISGTPAAGDTFTLSPRASGVADGSNALVLGALQRRALIGDGTSTFSGAYAQLVSDVGNRTMQVQVARTTQDSLASQIRASQQSVSGVNQDEETANLLQYQQMYQANAKVIQAASTIFETILAIR